MREILQRHWRSYGNDPLPTPAEALDQPLRAFPNWFLRVECVRCGAMLMISERHGALTIREIIAHMHCCGGQPGRVELTTGVEGVASHAVRWIVRAFAGFPGAPNLRSPWPCAAQSRPGPNSRFLI